MPKKPKQLDLITAALAGYRHRRQEILAEMADIKRRMAEEKSTSKRKRQLSDESRERIVAAQRRRWDKYRKKGE